MGRGSTPATSLPSARSSAKTRGEGAEAQVEGEAVGEVKVPSPPTRWVGCSRLSPG